MCRSLGLQCSSYKSVMISVLLIHFNESCRYVYLEICRGTNCDFAHSMIKIKMVSLGHGIIIPTKIQNKYLVIFHPTSVFLMKNEQIEILWLIILTLSVLFQFFVT